MHIGLTSGTTGRPHPQAIRQAMRLLLLGVVLAALTGCGSGGGTSTGGASISASATTAEDTEVFITPTVTGGTPGEAYVYAVVTGPSHGTAVVSGNRLLYTPAADYNGTDSFQFNATSSSGVAFAGSATITITAVNDPPASASAVITTAEDTVGTVTPTVSDPDSGDTHTFLVIPPLPANGTAGPTGTPGSQLTYTPNANFTGTDSFTFQIIDGAGALNTGSVSVTVSAVNDAPTSTSVNATVGFTLSTTLQPTVEDPDPDDTHTFNVSSPALTYGTVSVVGGNLVYTAGLTAGIDLFTFTATDGSGASVNGTARVTVDPGINVAPTSASATLNTDEDTVGFATPSVVDPNPGDSFKLSIVSQPAMGTASVANGMLRYVPDANYNGADSFTFRATDGGDLSRDGTCTVTVNPVNDPPSAAIATLTAVEDTAATPVTPTVTDIDDSPPFTLAIETQPAQGTAGVASGQLTYTPNANYDGSDSFTFRATDSGGGYVIGNAGVTITAVNDAPSVNDIGVVTLEDRATSNIVPSIDDVDGDLSFTLAIATAPSNGTVSEDDVRITYTPTTGFYGIDTFTYTANDGALDSTAATVTVHVTGSIATAAQPEDVVFGDFDGDSDQDVAVANFLGDVSSQVVTVFLNAAGTGTLDSGTHIDPNAGSAILGSIALAAGNLDGDGDDDLVIVYQDDDSYAVFPGNAGLAATTANARVSLGSGFFPRAVALGDFDGGGVLDLAVVGIFADQINIYAGNGDGTFAGTPSATLATGTSSSPFDVVTGDFDNDGNTDVAAVPLQVSATDYLSPYLGDGTGTTFTAPVTVEDAALLLEDDADLAVGDFNGDGRDDLVRTLKSTHQVAVFLSGAGGSMSSHTTYSVDLQPSGVAVADVTGNGNLDIVTSNAGNDSTSLLAGDGAGGFAAAVTTAAHPFPGGIATGNLNGSGGADIVTVHPADNILGVTLY
ncbi:MAG: tandem-95 repeat protein [Leptospirillia bacterium]